MRCARRALGSTGLAGQAEVASLHGENRPDAARGGVADTAKLTPPTGLISRSYWNFDFCAPLHRGGKPRLAHLVAQASFSTLLKLARRSQRQWL